MKQSDIRFYKTLGGATVEVFLFNYLIRKNIKANQNYSTSL